MVIPFQVVAGMRTEEQDLNIKIAATQALANALEFADRNFQATFSHAKRRSQPV